MNVTSKHLDLISNAENEAIDAYYEKMEKKEQMEEKMLTTYKLDCKAFKCLKVRILFDLMLHANKLFFSVYC